MTSKSIVAKRVGLIAAVAIADGGLTACGHDNYKDLKGVTNVHPDYIENVENMDGHPNIGVVCIKCAGFATTTRSYSAITRIPEWDSFCKSKERR